MTVKVPKESELKRRNVAAEKRIAEASASTIAALRRAVREYGLRLQLVLNDAFADKDKLPRLADMIAVGQQLNAALLESGLEDVAKLFVKELRAVEREAVSYFGSFGIAESRAGLDTQSLNALRSYQQQQFLNLADRRLVAPIRDAVIAGVVGGRERSIVLEQITNVIEAQGILTRADEEFTDWQIETLVDDSYRRHYRQTKALKAEQLDMKIVWFQGPDDEKTSRQCHFMLNSAPHGAQGMWLVDEFTMDNINALMASAGVKAQLREDPVTAGGHFNCRHNVTFVTRGFAEQLGFEAPKGEDIATDEEVEENAEEL